MGKPTHNPLPTQVMRNINLAGKGDYKGGGDGPIVRDLGDANVVTSLVGGTGIPGMHKPVLDIDMPVRVEPSSTPGHFHLYIDRAMSSDAVPAASRRSARCGHLGEG